MTKRFFLACLIFFAISGKSFSEPVTFSDKVLEPFEDWHVAGENHFRYDYYATTGNDGGSVFPYDSNQVYNETRLSMDRQISLYELVSLSSALLINGSEYRSAETGWGAFEDLRFSWQKGDAAIPFRLNAGDYLANLSYRTIQQNLKGVQLELQPQIHVTGPEERHSVILFYGINQRDYRRIDLGDNISSGGSWLMDLAKYGAWGFHIVHNHQEADVLQNRGQINQLTWSFTFEKIFNILKQRLAVEAEVAKFMGDFQSNRGSTEYNGSDVGRFFKIAGSNDTPLTYGFRYENYGDDFYPQGGIVSPNRRTLAWTSGWQFQNGLRVDGRIENYRDNFETGDQIKNSVQGLALSGPIKNPWIRDLSIYADISRESYDNKDRLTNVRTWSYNGDVNAALYQAFRGHFGYSIQNSADGGYSFGTISRQYVADISHPLTFGEILGSAKVGSIWRENSGINGSYEYGPTFSISFWKGRHSFDYNAKALWAYTKAALGQDVATFEHSAGYSYTYGPHRLTIDFQMYNRHPYQFMDPTQDYRFGAAYTFSFDKPAGRDVRDFSWLEGYRPKNSPILEDVGAEIFDAGLQLLTEIQPGQTIESFQTLLAQNGIKQGTEVQDLIVYEARVLKDIAYRQRLFVEHENGKIKRAGLIIDMDRIADARTVEYTLQRVRGLLAKKLGNPAVDIQDGGFSNEFREDIRAEKLVRLTEWKKNSGGKMRVGIPRRADQLVRIEIQSAADFNSARETHWSVETIS